MSITRRVVPMAVVLGGITALPLGAPPGAAYPARSSAARGLALVSHTPDSLPRYTPSNLRCTSCHLDGGHRPDAAPLVGVMRRYPKFMERAGHVVTITERVNNCIIRSLTGRPLPVGGRDMRDILAYLESISRGVGADGHVIGQGMPALARRAGDRAKGVTLYTTTCARCHGADGAGSAVVPALWGARSYSIGASMARVERAASFIRHNMPFDKPGTLTDEQSFDLAAFIDAQPRPDAPGTAVDWPNGDAPPDVPYATAGHAPFDPPPLLPRMSTRGARHSSEIQQ